MCITLYYKRAFRVLRDKLGRQYGWKVFRLRRVRDAFTYTGEYCLWSIFHHMSCDEYAHKRFDRDAGSLKWNKEWRAFRVKELPYWLEELKRPGVKCVGLW